MSAVKGVNKTIIDAAGASGKLAKGLADGRVKVMIDTYEAAGLVLGSTIEMGEELPVGARVEEIVLHTDNLTNNTTLSVGDSTSAARYYSATDHGAAETIGRIDTIAGRDYVITATTRQILLTTGAGAATGTIELAVYYTAD